MATDSTSNIFKRTSLWVSKSIISRLPFFLQTGIWLLGDAFGRYKTGIMFAVFLGFSGATFQVGAVLLLYRTSSLLVGAGDVEIARLSLTLDRNSFFYIASGATLAMVGLSAAFIYYYRRRSVVYWRLYQLALNEEILKATSQAVREGRLDGDQLECSPVHRYMMVSSVRRLALLFRNLILAVEVVIKFALYLLLSLYVNIGLTLLLMSGAVVVVLMVVLKFGRNSSRQVRALQTKNVDAATQWQQLAKEAFRGEPVSLGEIDNDDNPIGAYLTSFQARFIDVERSKLTAKIAMIVLLLMTLGIFGGPALDGNLPWPDLVAALVAVMMTMTSLASLSGTVAVFGRFYPDVDKYRRFTRALTVARNHSQFKRMVAPLGLSGDKLEEDDM